MACRRRRVQRLDRDRSLQIVEVPHMSGEGFILVTFTYAFRGSGVKDHHQLTNVLRGSDETSSRAAWQHRTCLARDVPRARLKPRAHTLANSSSCASVTNSSLRCANSGSPAPKFVAGIFISAKVATSVHPTLPCAGHSSANQRRESIVREHRRRGRRPINGAHPVSVLYTSLRKTTRATLRPLPSCDRAQLGG